MEKVTVISGGAGGMGLATAKIVGKDHHVVLSDVKQQGLEKASEELKALGITCDYLVSDITDRKSVDELVKLATSKGRLASVIHTAGLSPQMATPEIIMRVNALGTVNISEAFFEVAGEGFAQVNVASMSAYMVPGLLLPKKAYPLALTNPDKFMKKMLSRSNLLPQEFMKKGMAYSISKNFVVWYSRQSAGKFGQKGARILSVSPGSFDTEMGHLEEKSGSAEMLETAAIKRFGRPEEIAELLAFCAGEKASYLTGTDILCDGGVVAGRVKF